MRSPLIPADFQCDGHEPVCRPSLAMKRHSQRILVVDDDYDEQFLIEHALAKVISNGSTVNVVNSGDEAIAYMMGEGEFADRSKHPFPSCVITDLNMSQDDGFDVLEFMQANPSWNVVPRVLISLSDDDDDVRTAFLLGGECVSFETDELGGLAGPYSRSCSVLGHLSCRTGRRDG